MNRNKITLYNIASTIILQGIAFLSGPIFSGLLGTSNYGVIAVYLAWVQIASIVFSLQAASTIAIARVNFPMEDQEKYQSSVFSLATLCYAGFAIVTLGICVVAQNKLGVSIPMVALGLVHGWGWYCVNAMNSKFTYEFKANKNFFLSVTTSICTVGLSIILIYLEQSTRIILNFLLRLIRRKLRDLSLHSQPVLIRSSRTVFYQFLEARSKSYGT